MSYANSVNNEFLNNLTVSTETAGATSTMTVENADNSNAASHANVAVTTGGASAGDAYIHFYNGVVDWSLGIDNSDTDAFVISKSSTLGTTNVARCTTSGEWNYPLQPCFCAQKDADAANVTGQGNLYQPVYNVERVDQNSDYNTGTGIFTAPVTGKYLITTVCYFNDLLTPNSPITDIITSNRTYHFRDTVLSGKNCNQTATGGTVLADMDAADTAYTSHSTAGEASKRVDYIGAETQRNHFSGALLQ